MCHDSELRFTSLSQESQTDSWFCLSGESAKLSEEHPVAPVAENRSCDLSSRQNHACEADFLRTIRVVLEYMNDPKEHGKKRGNNLLASVQPFWVHLLLTTIVNSRAEHLFEVINSRDDVLRTWMRRYMYLRYVEARLADRILHADEILKYGFCLNVIKTSLCPLEVLKNMQEEAVRDDDIVFKGLPSTEPF
ncbi:hypothetical protein HID58_036194 [Brassica napus]|uniref:Uncharacterized protein n=1 Tax=Brassica napus TaxID=3708 RepID=A0ABQ8C7A3_BRANA|nr:hypothetical protein HID58_036194 [Brassica napus]